MKPSSRKKTSHTLLFGLFAVILFGVYYLGFYNETLIDTNIFTATLKDTRSNNEHIVELRDDGFYPEELEINKGDTVKFKTTRGKLFWPASNLHPSHGIYSEFDSKEPINPEDTWSFSFEESGKWKYHDHLFPNYGGKIIVLNEEGEAVSAISKCLSSNLGDKQACWDEQLGLVLETRGLDAAFNFFVELYKTEPSTARDCHGWGHILGEAAYDLFADKKDFIMRKETSYCGYGFYHGFMEELLLATGDIKKTREFCSYVSNEMQANKLPYMNCIHGIGHGASAGAAEDPRFWGNYQAIIDVGVRTCEEVVNIPDELEVCWEGAFNELQNAINVQIAGLSYDLIKDDFFRICREQEEKYKTACYFETVGMIHRVTGHDFDKAARMVIKEISNPEMAVITIRKMSADFMAHDISNPNNDKNVFDCRSLPEFLRVPCFNGIMIGFIAHGEPEAEYVKGLEFCATPILTEDERGFCYDWMLGQFQSIYPEEMEKICEMADPKYNIRCNK